MLIIVPLLAADVPRWIWAALLMAAIVAVTVLTMWLVRYPLRRMLRPSREENERSPREDAR